MSVRSVLGVSGLVFAGYLIGGAIARSGLTLGTFVNALIAVFLFFLGVCLVSMLVMLVLDLSGLSCPVKRALADKLGYDYTPSPYGGCERWKKKE